MPRLFVLLLLVFTGEAAAQGFNIFSGRNHPELDWKVAETAHFEIMYPARLAGIEAEAAPIAEATYATLAANLGVTFDRKIRIYLSDEDEVVNGFAVGLNDPYTAIWVHQNAGMEVWTGQEKWLRKVLAHELTHIFHYRAVQTGSRLLNVLLGNPLPRFWAEGLAQYQTETWDAQRGDRWLRTAVLDDALDYNDARSVWNGRLLYASGNAQVRYFAATYGDSTLARLLAHRTRRFGLIPVHNFGEAFEDIVDLSYRQFYDDWRRHINVYYNTLAGQLENLDSLGTDPLGVPGQYLYDLRYSPDTTRLAVVALTALDRPVTRLFAKRGSDVTILAEGSIHAPVAWSPDGRHLAYARTTRGAHGSLVNDLYLVETDGTHRRRLTRDRRASAPAFSPDGRHLAFVGSTGGTANVFLLNPATGEETPLTYFTGDVQLSGLRWHPTGDHLAVARFDPQGRRELLVIDRTTGAVTAVTDGTHDDRTPVWSPNGRSLAYTSLRDDVPNVFVVDLDAGRHRRVTALATGATVTDWLPPDSAHSAGSLVVITNASKGRDRAYRIDAARNAPGVAPRVPPEYATWTTHRPPQTLPSALAPQPSLITRRADYRAWSNLTHAASFALPYFNSTDDWGLFGFTAWIEPLGKHVFAAGGSLAAPDPAGKSFFLASYANNQWYPTITLNAYRFPGSAQRYGDGVLVEDFLGGDLAMTWPLDWSDAPYTEEYIGARLRYIDVEPLDLDDLADDLDNLPVPESAQQADLALTFQFRKQRPYRHNTVHPLDGLGLRVQALGAARVLGTDSRFVRGDVAAFGILRSIGLQRLYVYGRAQVQTGEPRPQDVLGLSRYDYVQFPLAELLPTTLGNAERVRGFRSYALGNRVLFGSIEYRVPFLPDLQTELFGLLRLGATSLAVFADGGIVWSSNDFDGAVRRIGLGAELKNTLRIGRLFELAHSLGIAQPAPDLVTDEHVEVYYRIRAAVPF